MYTDKLLYGVRCKYYSRCEGMWHMVDP